MTTVTRRQTFSIAGGVLATMASSANAQAAPIKIGCGMALTGGLAAGGKSGLVAYQIWADEVNARGGLLGRKVELVSYDDQSNPATVPGIYSKLLDIDKVDVVVSGYATVPTAAAMPPAADQITAYTSSGSWVKFSCRSCKTTSLPCTSEISPGISCLPRRAMMSVFFLNL